MKIALLYYSGAGNTKFIAKNIYKKLKNKSYEIEMFRISSKIIDISKQNIDLYIVGFPVYDVSAPKLVTDFIQNLKTESKPIAYFCTKALLSADSILELSEISTGKGLRTIATLDLFMPATDMLALFAKKNSKTENILKYLHSRNIKVKLDKFITRIEKGKELNISKKWYSYLAFLIPNKTKKAFHDQYTKYIPEFQSLNDICIECMLCVKNCPRENIIFKNGIKFGLNCDMCLNCFHHCPVEAINIGNRTNGTVRYNKVKIKI